MGCVPLLSGWVVVSFSCTPDGWRSTNVKSMVLTLWPETALFQLEKHCHIPFFLFFFFWQGMQLPLPWFFLAFLLSNTFYHGS